MFQGREAKQCSVLSSAWMDLKAVISDFRIFLLAKENPVLVPQ